jgi:hypothetical protein
MAVRLADHLKARRVKPTPVKVMMNVE